MNNTEKTLTFWLSTGGLFHRLLLKLRLVAPDRYHPWRRIVAFTGLTWLPLLILTAVGGTLTGGVNISFLHDPVPHVRYLIALPLLIIAERVIDPYMATIVQYFQTSGLVADKAHPLYIRALERMIRLRDAAWVDTALFGLSFGMIWILKFGFGLSFLDKEPSSWMSTTGGGAEMLSFAGWWLLFVSAPFLQFIIYRWIWRFIIWAGFLNRISQLDLMLQPTHPDHVGGLGILAGGQSSFGLIFATVGAMMSATLAHEILHTGRKLVDMQWEIAGYVLVCFAIITIPLCTFFSPLFSAKRRGLRHYSTLARLLSEAFQIKWTKNTTMEQAKDLIAAADPSAVADYSVVFETISSMRLIPLKRKTVIVLLFVLVAPFLPLVLTQISIKEALQRLAQTLV